ncbi:MAG: D-alanyl-D-alanine carboxypeptidase family protein [Pseudomonadota bacterium]
MSLLKHLSSLFALCLSLAAPGALAALPTPPAPQLDARAWLLIDAASGVPLAEKAADTKVEPASLTKLMTAYLSFAAIKEGRLKLDQTLPVSEKAWRAEGSRMFLEPSKPAKVEDLLRGMIIQSGNDACIVLAEAIAGSEEGFASMMNQMAKRLGMSRSHFVNATGLPDPQHYTTARDLAILATALIRDFPEHYRIYAEREFAYNGIRQPNRNRLLYMDPSVDGVKTGHTESAGYCLIASAQRERRRLLSVVLGTGSDTARAMESQKLLNYGFQFFETVKLYPANKAVSSLRIYKGSQSDLQAGFTRDFLVTVPRGTASRIKASLVTRQPMLAPVRRGERVGSLRLTVDGQVVGDYPLQALHDVSVAGLLGRGWDSLLLMFK